MAEDARERVEKLLYAMELSCEDMTQMIQLNCKCVAEWADEKTLLDICVNGITHGAMLTICPNCKIILHEDGDRYKCLAMMSMQRFCTYVRYTVKTADTPWEIPQSATNQSLKLWRPLFENYKPISFLDRDMASERKNVIKDINEHKTFPKKNLVSSSKKRKRTFPKKNNRVILKLNGILYNFFCVNNEDFTTKKSHVICQVQKDLDIPSKRRYSYVIKEKLLPSGAVEHSASNLLAEEAISRFEDRFIEVTGNPWSHWIHGEFIRSEKRMIPLDIDIFTKLSYEKAEEIDGLHKQLAVKLEYLKKLKIKGVQIKEVLITRAEKVTLDVIRTAKNKLDGIKHFEKQGTHQELVLALKKELRLFDGTEVPDLVSLSIIARLISSPGGTTLRLFDIPEKYILFTPMLKILDVFFRYHGVKDLLSSAEITQNYMMEKTLSVIGRWIMELVFSNEQAHHHYVEKKDSPGCYWSVLLRKAEKAFERNSSNLLILSTIDIETVSNPDKMEDIMNMDKQADVEKITLYKVNEKDYDKYGYIVQHGEQAREPPTQ